MRSDAWIADAVFRHRVSRDRLVEFLSVWT
jgi:hypothetical protein